MTDPVWIIDMNKYGYIIERHTYHSLVAYETNGIIVEEMFNNDDLIEREGHAIDYRTE